MLSKSVFVTAIALAIPSVAAATPAKSDASDAAHGARKDPKRRTALVTPEARAHARALPPLPAPSADGHAGHAKDCLKGTVRVVAGTEEERFALAKCDGTAAPLAVERLSVLVRPASAPHPVASPASLAKSVHGTDLAPGVRRVDVGLVERLAKVAEHFSKSGAMPRVTVVSGYRPASTGSYHASARALDFKIEGVTNEQLVAFCKTLPDTGCGYYPNSMFVHMDVRDRGTGHISWIDASAPGEAPRYVPAWPPHDDARHDETPRHEEARHDEGRHEEVRKPEAAREEARSGHARVDVDMDTIPAMPAPRMADARTAEHRK